MQTFPKMAVAAEELPNRVFAFPNKWSGIIHSYHPNMLSRGIHLGPERLIKGRHGHFSLRALHLFVLTVKALLINRFLDFQPSEMSRIGFPLPFSPSSESSLPPPDPDPFPSRVRSRGPDACVRCGRSGGGAPAEERKMRNKAIVKVHEEIKMVLTSEFTLHDSFFSMVNSRPGTVIFHIQGPVRPCAAKKKVVVKGTHARINDHVTSCPSTRTEIVFPPISLSSRI